MATDPIFGIELPVTGEVDVATLNRNIVWNRALLRGDLVDYRTTNNDPSSLNPPPAEGDLHATGTAPVGDWAGHPEEFALYYNGGWIFAAIPEGIAMQCDVANDFEYDLLLRVNGAWESFDWPGS